MGALRRSAGRSTPFACRTVGGQSREHYAVRDLEHLDAAAHAPRAEQDHQLFAEHSSDLR